MKKTGIITVSGFLGSGKTSFILNLIKKMPGKRLGFIVNDFGSIAVDHEIIGKSFTDMEDGETGIIAIDNGSIFCSCRESAFLDGLRFYLDDLPDYLIIETSGISDPSAMPRIAAFPEFSEFYDLYSSVCIINAENFLMMLPRFLFMERQVMTAGIIILNKTDLADENKKNKAIDKIMQLNPDCRIIKSVHGNADISFDKSAFLLKTSAGAENSCGVSEKPGRMTLPSGRVSPEYLENLRDKLGPLLLRIKGFLEYNGAVYQVDGTGPGYTVNLTQIKPDRPGITLIFDKKYSEQISGFFE